MRGEGLQEPLHGPIELGRSPRARGRRTQPTNIVSMDRSIPACAGKAPRPGPRAWPDRVDPRVRGEGRIQGAWERMTTGRSPRARGRLAHRRRAPKIIGSIPACAGKAVVCRSGSALHRVDPRVRGEGMAWALCTVHFLGRSPRARGRRLQADTDQPAGGSIPACAGKAGSGPVSNHRHRVDPRVRGEGAWI